MLNIQKGFKWTITNGNEKERLRILEELKSKTEILGHISSEADKYEDVEKH